MPTKRSAATEKDGRVARLSNWQQLYLVGLNAELKIRCNKEENRACKDENVEYAVHITFVNSKDRRAEQARDKPCKEDDTCCRGYTFWREIGGEERRKHQSADDKRGDDGHVFEYIEPCQAQHKHDDCNHKGQRKRNVAVHSAVQKAS